MSAADEALRNAYSFLRSRKWPHAEAQARRVLRDVPTCASALYVLANVVSDRGDDFEALRLLQSAIAWDSKLIPAYRLLSQTYYSMGRLAEAGEVYRAWSKIEPNNPVVLHMIAALTGQNVPSRCSESYVHNHFNQLAVTFDDVLVKRLAYRGPEVIEAALEKHRGIPSGTLTVLDAGCGTGLCGPLLRPHARCLTGVDLAGRMIEQARKRKSYDELFVSELCTFMESRPEAFDAVVSSDVLIYFGALEQPMQAAYRALKRGGLLVLTVEALLDVGQDPYRLTTSGRYAHRDCYVHDVLIQAGFEILTAELEWLRWENGKKVMFHSVSARKQSH